MFQTATHAEDWSRRVLASSHTPFQQSWEWGEFQASVGNAVQRFSLHEDGYCQVIQKQLPYGMRLWYVPRSPRIHSEAELAEIRKLAGREQVILLRFEPEKALSRGREIEPVSPAVSQITDLSQGEEALLAAMHSKTRYDIRVAERKGVVVEESNDVEAWLSLIHETTERNGFRAHPDEYYRKMLACPIVKLFLAKHESRPLAGLIAVFYGDTVTYLHGASSNVEREVMAPYLLHWRLMLLAKGKGYTYYDWWGLNPDDAAHPKYKASWEGITRFKRRFGGELVEYPGTYEMPVRMLPYLLYEARRKFLR